MQEQAGDHSGTCPSVAGASEEQLRHQTMFISEVLLPGTGRAGPFTLSQLLNCPSPPLLILKAGLWSHLPVFGVLLGFHEKMQMGDLTHGRH